MNASQMRTLPAVPVDAIDRALLAMLEAAYAVHGQQLQDEHDLRIPILAGRIADLRVQMPPMAAGGSCNSWITVRDAAVHWLKARIGRRAAATDQNARLFAAATS